MFGEKHDNPVAWNTLAVTIGDSETNMQHECQGIPTCQLQRDTRCNPHLHCDRQDRLCETSALQQHRAPLDFILFSFAYIHAPFRLMMVRVRFGPCWNSVSSFAPRKPRIFRRAKGDNGTVILHAVMSERIGERHASACRYKKTTYRRAHATPLAGLISGRAVYISTPIPWSH